MHGLRLYVQTLASSIRIEVGDGTLMAAVKGVLGGEACGLLSCPGTAAPGSAAAPATAPAPPATAPGLLDLPLALPLEDLAAGDGGLFGFLSKVLGG